MANAANLHTQCLLTEEERDTILLLNINKWLGKILPSELNDLTKWDIYETLHDDNVSIIEIGSTVYKNNRNVAIQSFLDEYNDDEDDDIKTNPKQFNLEITKIEMLRIVLDFNGFKVDDDHKHNKPKVMAIYHKQNKKYQQIFKLNQFDDNEIHCICIDNEHELNEMEQCDLSLLLKSLSKKQLIDAIKSFLNKNTDKKRELSKKIKDLRNLKQLMVKDKEIIMIIVAQMVGFDAAIVDELNTFIDDDLYRLMNDRFKKNMMDLQNDINQNNLDVVLNDIECICKKAQSVNQLQYLISTTQQFLIDFLSMIDRDDFDELYDSKLNHRICDLEVAMERISNVIHVKDNIEKLTQLKETLTQWQKQLLDKLPMFGPLFSDNIRLLNKKLNNIGNKRKRLENDADNNGNMKKRKLC